ncbi:MAG: hypothetical protein ACXVFN_00235 [Solirubrobacteraceae bacterium]
MVPIAAVAAVLAPALPYLLRPVEKLANRAADAVAAEVWEHAQKLWARLRPKVEAKPEAKRAAEMVAAEPTDGRRVAALELELERLLAEDRELAAQIEAIMATVPATAIAAGERSIATAGNVRGIFVTGDNVTIDGSDAPET